MIMEKADEFLKSCNDSFRPATQQIILKDPGLITDFQNVSAETPPPGGQLTITTSVSHSFTLS